MITGMEPLEATSLKARFIERFEELILSGRFVCGEKLPPERELARLLEVSRPVVHEGLVELAAKGLVTIVPRRGTVVNDFRREGSVELLHSLLQYGAGDLQPGILKGMLEMRLLFEVEIAAQAAVRGSGEERDMISDALKAEERLFKEGGWRASLVAEADYAFHHSLAMASGNIVYPLLMNSFRSLYLNVLTRFYRKKIDFLPILQSHRTILALVLKNDAAGAAAVMRQLLEESSVRLNAILDEERRRL